MPRRIDSPKNETIKELSKLKERRHRDERQRYLIEGARELLRALESGIRPEAVIICPDFLSLEGKQLVENQLSQAPYTEVSKEAFERLSLRQNPDGILGVAAMQKRGLESLVLAPNPLVLIIDGLEKPGNIGALLRTADAAKLDAIFLTGQGTDLYNPNVIRSSLGSVFSRPVLAVEAEALLKWLEPQGFTLLAASPETRYSYWDASYQNASAIILGTEHEGLSPFWKRHATLQVTIPMYGTADSLNVATAGALLIYEALRQRHRGLNR
jgi:RNA methyltransferase, TrmH family